MFFDEEEVYQISLGKKEPSEQFLSNKDKKWIDILSHALCLSNLRQEIAYADQYHETQEITGLKRKIELVEDVMLNLIEIYKKDQE